MIENEYKTVFLSLLALLLVAFLISCEQTPSIKGKWQEVGKTSSIEFVKNGTFTAIDDMGMSVSGNYTLLPDKKIQLEIKHPDSSVEILLGSINVKGDKLAIISDDDKEVIVYKKINDEISNYKDQSSVK